MRSILIILVFLLIEFSAFVQQGFSQEITVHNHRKILDSGDSKFIGKIVSPVFHPLYSDIIAFSVSRSAEEKLLFIKNITTGELYEIKSKSSEEEEEIAWLKLAGTNEQLNWRPVESQDDKIWFAYVSSGNTANIDIYLGYIGMENPIRLTTHEEIDSYPQWSPNGNKIAFVSSRTGDGDIYLLENIDKVISSKNPDAVEIRQLTTNKGEDRNPAWHPGGNILVFSEYKQEETTEVFNFGIAMYDFKDEKYHKEYGSKRLTFTRPQQHETNPSWSPDGTKLAYYITDEPPEKREGYSEVSGEKVNIEWGTFGPPEKPEFQIAQGSEKYFATEVVPDPRGPSWGSNSQSVVYVSHDVGNYFPLVAANVDDWEKTGRSQKEYIQTNTRQNSHIMLLHEDNMPLKATFVALEGISYCLYAMEFRGSYFPISTKDYIAEAWKNRPSYPWSGMPWYRQKKYQAVIGTGMAGLIYGVIASTGSEENKPLPNIPEVPLPDK